jgi:hypothetical protein
MQEIPKLFEDFLKNDSETCVLVICSGSYVDHGTYSLVFVPLMLPGYESDRLISCSSEAKHEWSYTFPIACVLMAYAGSLCSPTVARSTGQAATLSTG